MSALVSCIMKKISFLQSYCHAGKITSSHVSEDEEESQEQNEQVTQPALKWRKLNEDCQEMQSHTSEVSSEYVKPVCMITTAAAAATTSFAGSGGVVKRVAAKRTSFLPSFRKRKTTSTMSPESASHLPRSPHVFQGVTVAAALQSNSSSPVRAQVRRSSLASAFSNRDQRGSPKKSVTFAPEAMTFTADPATIQMISNSRPKDIFLNGPRASKLLRRFVARHTPLPTVTADDLGESSAQDALDLIKIEYSRVRYLEWKRGSYFVAPKAVVLQSVLQLQREVFGNMFSAGLGEDDSPIPSQRWQSDENSSRSIALDESEEAMKKRLVPVSTSDGNVVPSSAVAPTSLQKLNDGIKPRTVSQSGARVLEPHAFDVLFGRGKRSHPGNQIFRRLCILHKAEYMKW